MVERRVIAVEGVVQGVGFRPYVYRLASANALRGFVRNDVGGVLIDVEGDAVGIDAFCRTLADQPPSLATVARLNVRAAPPLAYDSFLIAASDPSRGERRAAGVPADAATCNACLAELFDPTNRRFRHPFITCTDCGPRLTILRETPYDRERTTMAPFPLCPRCHREYEDPRDRRFHAESIACHDCGPTLIAYTGSEPARRLTGDGALSSAIAALRGGGIVAIKALGGFHFACDATDAHAVARLRQRKLRPAKPFAIMVSDADSAEALWHPSPTERDVLASPARPVVLLQRRRETSVAASVAPESRTLGVMLPSTPLHHLIVAALDRPLVMTSGNRGGDPVVIDDVNAVAALGDIADLFLTHDRVISERCDDSVVIVTAGAPRQVRRSRGYVPHSIPLPFTVLDPVLAVGGHLKNTICLAHGESAHLSAHVGDLDTSAARDAIRLAIDGTLRIAGVRPTIVAHDLHPDYASTHVAEAFAVEHDIARRVIVQHHHAHVAACVAETGIKEPVIGVVFDGAGLGTDGAIWGGEFLVVDGARFSRRGHLAYVPLPGGDAAARRPWCSAAAHAAYAGGSERPTAVAERDWRITQHLITRPDTARTSSVGRLFDAVASLLGLCHVSSFEGEAAMALERAADGCVAKGSAVTLRGGDCWTADPASIIESVITDLARRRDPSEIAAAFHGAMRDLVVLGCERVREETGLETVVLSGGVFMNRLLTESADAALAARRFRVLLPRLAPCNDGGLSLGQAYVAACALREGVCA